MTDEDHLYVNHRLTPEIMIMISWIKDGQRGGPGVGSDNSSGPSWRRSRSRSLDRTSAAFAVRELMGPISKNSKPNTNTPASRAMNAAWTVSNTQ